MSGGHDSKVALPLLKMAEKRCVFLYDLMDGGYSSGLIDSYSRSIGKIPVIDFKAPRGHEKPEMVQGEEDKIQGADHGGEDEQRAERDVHPGKALLPGRRRALRDLAHRPS